LVLSLACGVALVACKGEAKSKRDPAPSTRSPVVADGVKMLVDGEAAGVLSLTGERVLLADAVPKGVPPAETWVRVLALGVNRRQDILLAKNRNYQVLVFEDEQGRPTLGLFRNVPVEDGEVARPVQAVVNLTSVEIQTNATDMQVESVLDLEVVRDGRQVVLSKDALGALAQRPWRPDGKKARVVAWSLWDALALTGPLSSPVRVKILDVNGKSGTQELIEGDPGIVFKSNGAKGFQLKRVSSSGKTSWRFRNAVRIVIQ